jgi:hypothetical protein
LGWATSKSGIEETKLSRFLFVFIATVLTISGSQFSTTNCQAEEPGAEFLQSLRDAGYYDVAIDYLTRAADSDLVSAEFKRVLPFEKAETLIESTAQIRDVKQWEPRLDEAETLLNQYAESATDPNDASRVVRFQGDLQYKRARIYMLMADSDRLTADEKTELNIKSRSKLSEALEKHKTARGSIRELIDNYQIDPEDPNSESELKKLRAVYTQVRVRLPLVTEQLSDTYPETAPEKQKILQEAIAEYSDLWKKYSGYKAGLDACLFGGRCHQKLGQHKEALYQFEEIFKLGSNSALKKLKKKAMILATDSWSQLSEYPHEKVVQYLSTTVAVLNRQEKRDPEWLRIQLELARAMKIKADIVDDEKRTGAKTEARNLKQLASKYAKAVARTKNPHQELAKSWIEELGLSAVAATASDADVKPAANFDEARQRGKDLIAEVEVSLREYLDAKKGGDAAAAEAAQEQLFGQTDLALSAFDTALSMADEETPRVDINNVRYLQSYCYFAKERYLESAIIGEFLLEKYPTVDWSKNATSLAIKSYVKLVETSAGPEKEFYNNRLAKAGASMVNRWAGSDDAASAAARMTSMAISDRDFEQAEQYFKMIPDSSGVKKVLGAQLAQSLWDRYNKQKAATPNDPQNAANFATAKKYLVDAVAVGSVDDVSYPVALSGLFLVEAYLEAGEVDKAIAQLESAPVSPIELVKIGHPSIQNPKINKIYKFATFKTTIKAYLAAMKTSTDPQVEIEKVNNVIKAMSQLAADNPKDQGQVTRVYGRIAKDLKEQFGMQASIEQKKSFASTVEIFFSQIGRGSQDPPTLFWAADTLLDMSQSLADEGAPEKSQDLSSLAVELLGAAEKTGLKTDQIKLQYQQLLALAKRGSGNYQDAVAKFAELLKQRNGLNLQIDAAKTLQIWGLNKQDGEQLKRAMMGTEPAINPKTKRKENVIWGWRKLVAQTRGNEKYQSQYRECLYYSIECRFRYGQFAKSDKAIKSSLSELEKALVRYPFLKDGSWKAKFEKLLSELKSAN